MNINYIGMFEKVALDVSAIRDAIANGKLKVPDNGLMVNFGMTSKLRSSRVHHNAINVPPLYRGSTTTRLAYRGLAPKPNHKNILPNKGTGSRTSFDNLPSVRKARELEEVASRIPDTMRGKIEQRAKDYLGDPENKADLARAAVWGISKLF